MLVLALSTGHKIGLGVVAAVFIAFALSSAFLFPRFRATFPGRGLPAFVVVAFVFFFGMLTAVEVFGAESAKGGKETVAEQRTTAPQTTTQTQTTTQEPTTAPKTTTRIAVTTVNVSEREFKISGISTELSPGKYTFDVKDDGKIPHDLAIKGGAKTKLIQPGGSAQLEVTLKAGKYHFYCSVPGHEQAGMKVDVTVS